MPKPLYSVYPSIKALLNHYGTTTVALR